MANTVIQLRHSTLTGNVPSTLANGEISINNRDGKFFYSTPAGAIITHYPYPGPAGLNQEIQFNDSGVLGSDSGLTYNKTTDVLTVVGGAIVDGVNVAPQIQSAYNHANAAFNQANTGGGADQFARNTANAAYATANTKDFTFYQDTAPSTANSRDAWIDTDTGVLYKNFGNVTHPVWVETGPTGFSNVSGALAGDLVVSGNITPLTDNVYSLGSASYRFKDVFVGPGSVNIDGLVLSNVNGKLIINGASDLVLPGTQVPSTLSISNHANSAFTKANNALANTSGTLAGNLNITGSVGIGTSSLTNKFQVSAGSADVARFTNTLSNGGDWQLKIGGNGFEDRKLMITDKFDGADNVRVAIDSSGNMGIGTVSPGFKTEIISSYNNGIQLKDTSGTVYGGVFVETGVMAYGVRSNHSLRFIANDAEQARLTTAGLFQFNSGYGSVATAYGCRAWVNYNGTGTPAIRSSGNVSSITDDGTGNYRVNFTNAMPDENYSALATSNEEFGVPHYCHQTQPSTTNVRIKTYNNSSTASDCTYISVGIFR